MTNNKRLTNEELAQIKERAEKANNGNYLLSPEVISYLYDSVDDVPKLLAEVETLKAELVGDGVLTLAEQFNYAREEIRRLGGLVGHYKGYADRFSDDIAEYKAENKLYRRALQDIADISTTSPREFAIKALDGGDS